MTGEAVGTSATGIIDDYSPAAAMKAQDLGVSTGSGHNGVVVTLYANFGPTALTCTTNSAGTCTDTTHHVAIPAGTFLYWNVNNPVSGSSAGALIGMEMTG